MDNQTLSLTPDVPWIKSVELPSFEGPFRSNMADFLLLCGQKVSLDHTRFRSRVSAWVVKLDAEAGGSGAYLHVYEEKLTSSESALSCDNCRNMGERALLRLI